MAKPSRDFCYVDNAVQANILAATGSSRSKNEVYNVAVGVSYFSEPTYRLLK